MLNGKIVTRNEILFFLGHKQRKFVPETYKAIASRMVARKDKTNYPECPYTIQELYELPVGTDLSQ